MKFGTLCKLDAACVIVGFSLEITRAGFVNGLSLGDVHFGFLLLRWPKFAKLQIHECNKEFWLFCKHPVYIFPETSSVSELTIISSIESNVTQTESYH